MEDKKMDEIAKRIKARREQLSFSLQDIANLTDMSKSTLQRYETGGIKNLPLSKLTTLASALSTTPDYIMGWNEKKPTTASDDGLPYEDELLLKLFHAVPENQRPIVLGMIEAALKTQGLL